MSTSQTSQTEEIVALLNKLNDIFVSEPQIGETPQLKQLVVMIEENMELQNNDKSDSIQSEEGNQSIDQYSKVDLSQDFAYRIKMADQFACLQRNREKLFRRHRCQQQKNLLARMAQIQKEYSTKQQSFLTQKSSAKNRRSKGLNQSKKQICFKGNSSKLEKIAFLAEDIARLGPSCDLNDNIIENYLKLLNHFFLPSWISCKVHIFCTYFFSKLIGSSDPQEYFEGQSKKDIEDIKQAVKKNYPNIKRWTKNLDISEKQIIIFPINAFKHWFCIMALNLNHINSQYSSSQNQVQIIYCDSMFQKKPIIVSAIKEYLRLEILQKKEKCIHKILQNAQSYQLLLPRQLNTHDCGLYMLTYVDQLLTNPQQLKALSFPQNRNKLRLFPRKLIFTMRLRLIKLIDRFTSTHHEQRNNDVLLRFFKEKNDILQNSQGDFDEINGQQFQKFKKLNLINPHQINYSPEELEYCLLVRFYLDCEIKQNDVQVQPFFTIPICPIQKYLLQYLSRFFLVF